jgi:hypothetical protein
VLNHFFVLQNYFSSVDSIVSAEFQRMEFLLDLTGYWSWVGNPTDIWACRKFSLKLAIASFAEIRLSRFSFYRQRAVSLLFFLA